MGAARGFVAAFLLLALAAAELPEAETGANLVLIGIAVGLGAFGNHLYRRHVDRLVAEAVHAAAGRQDMLDRLAVRGGTSPVAAGIAAGVVLLLAAAVAVQMQREAATYGEELFGDKPPADYYDGGY